MDEDGVVGSLVPPPRGIEHDLLVHLRGIGGDGGIDHGREEQLVGELELEGHSARCGVLDGVRAVQERQVPLLTSQVVQEEGDEDVQFPRAHVARVDNLHEATGVPDRLIHPPRPPDVTRIVLSHVEQDGNVVNGTEGIDGTGAYGGRQGLHRLDAVHVGAAQDAQATSR